MTKFTMRYGDKKFKKLRKTIVLMLDAYKLFHRQMYPPNTTMVFSNFTARRGRHRGKRNEGYVIAFGMQRLVRKLRDEFQDFFNTDWDTLEPFLKSQLDSFTGSDYSIDHLKELHELGYLPLKVKALKEGTRVPYGIPYLTVRNSNPRFSWLTNYLETWFSTEQWNCVTSATTVHQYKKLFDKWALKTVGNTDFVPIQGHDFSARGQNGTGAWDISGLGHLTSFVGTDTVPAYMDAQYYYDAPLNDWKDFPKGIIGTSVPATEHSIASANIGLIEDKLKKDRKWGKYDIEFLAKGM